MKTLLFAFLAATLLIPFAGAADPPAKKLNVLFIGNSLTSTNDLPAMLAAMAAAKGQELTYGRNIVGGATLEKHWNEGKALKLIKQGKWDYVVLQDLSTQAYKGKDSMFKNAKLFDEEIRKVNARTALYMTWALENSPENFPALSEAYTTLAKELKATLIPAGEAWRVISNATEKPAFPIYKTDHKHPVPAGTYLAACVFYRVFFGAPSTGLPGHLEWQKKVVADLPKEVTDVLQKAADSVALTKAE